MDAENDLSGKPTKVKLYPQQEAYLHLSANELEDRNGQTALPQYIQKRNFPNIHFDAERLTFNEVDERAVTIQDPTAIRTKKPSANAYHIRVDQEIREHDPQTINIGEKQNYLKPNPWDNQRVFRMDAGDAIEEQMNDVFLPPNTKVSKQGNFTYNRLEGGHDLGLGVFSMRNYGEGKTIRHLGKKHNPNVGFARLVPESITQNDLNQHLLQKNSLYKRKPVFQTKNERELFNAGEYNVEVV